MNQPLLDLVAFGAGAVAVVVDRRRAVPLACLAVALGLAPSAATYGGGWAAVIVLGAGAAAAVAVPLAHLAGRLRAAQHGVDPLVPVGSPSQGLFGPRSVRVAGGAVVLVAASWVSFNVPVGSVVAVRGALFPVAFVFACGALRTFLARNLTDVGVGLAVIALAVGVAWLLRGGSDPLPAAGGMFALAPVVAAADAWLHARHPRPAAQARS